MLQRTSGFTEPKGCSECLWSRKVNTNGAEQVGAALIWVFAWEDTVSARLYLFLERQLHSSVGFSHTTWLNRPWTVFLDLVPDAPPLPRVGKCLVFLWKIHLHRFGIESLTVTNNFCSIYNYSNEDY